MSTEQLVLLAETVTPIARREDPVTSKIAAATMREGAALQRGQVLEALERRGSARRSAAHSATRSHRL